MNLTLKTSIALGTLSCFAVVQAQVIDQQDATNNAYMAAFAQTDLAQSFQQSVNNITAPASS